MAQQNAETLTGVSDGSSLWQFALSDSVLLAAPAARPDMDT